MENIVIDVKTSLPVINSNFEVIKNQLQEELQKYNLVVDQDSIKTAKKWATEINKLSKMIDDKRKEKVKELSAPIKEFETKAKELTALCQETRQNLLQQVKTFEDKEVEKAKELLRKELKNLYEKYGVGDEFQKVKYDDLAIISNLTKSGLAKKAKDALDDRVLKAKKLQEKIDKRLSTLEAICFKGGLQAPLTRKNIEHFLFEDSDDVYLEKLVSLIENEIDRIDRMKQLEAKETAKKQPLPQNIPTQPETEQEPKAQSVNDRYAKFKNNVFATKKSKKTFVVTAVFEVEVDESMESKLSEMLTLKFKKSGFKTLPTVTVREKIRAA